MSFDFKFKLYTALFTLSILLVLISSIYMIVDLKVTEDNIDKLTNENVGLIFENSLSIDNTFDNIMDIEKLLYNPTLPEKIHEFNTINKHIDMSSKEDLQKAINIVDSTPLDLVTASIIVGYTKKLNVPPSLLIALIEQESNFKQYELGNDKDRGYCQIIPGTEKWLAQTYGHILGIEYDTNRIYEPEYNIGLGALYLHILSKAYGNDFHKILSEYNRGTYNLQKYYSQHGTYITSYSRGILNRETKYNFLNYK